MTALTVGELQQRVDRGVGWLDANHPGWVDIASPCLCVVGQLFGGFDMDLAGLDYDEVVELGFDLPSPVASAAQLAEQYEVLTSLWTAAIEARRAVPPDRP